MMIITIKSILDMTENVARKLVNLNGAWITIGWVSCRTRRWVPVKQYYKCQEYA